MPTTKITGPFRPRIPRWNTKGASVWLRKTASLRPAPGEPARAAIVIEGRVYFRAKATDETIPLELANFAGVYKSGEWVAPLSCLRCHGTRYAWDEKNPRRITELGKPLEKREPCPVCNATGVAA